MAKKIICPRLLCKSKDITPIAQRGGYGVVKGAAGGMAGAFLLGPVGALAGAAAGFNGKKKVSFRCNKCGYVFVAKA